MMNGERRGTATGTTMAVRPSANFGPSWPEVAGFFLQYRKKRQKSTYTGKFPQGVKRKMSAVFTHELCYGFFGVLKD
nr:hypothetical protein [uncultured Caproiciproducens sp.]